MYASNKNKFWINCHRHNLQGVFDSDSQEYHDDGEKKAGGLEVVEELPHSAVCSLQNLCHHVIDQLLSSGEKRWGDGNVEQLY